VFINECWIGIGYELCCLIGNVTGRTSDGVDTMMSLGVHAKACHLLLCMLELYVPTNVHIDLLDGGSVPF
jgi:hypothetical protein